MIPAAPRNCAEARDQYLAWLDGELAEPETASLEAHVAGCTGCRAEAESIAAIHRDLCVRAQDLDAENEAGIQAVLAALRDAEVPVAGRTGNATGRSARVTPRAAKALGTQRRQGLRALSARTPAFVAAGLLLAAGALVVFSLKHRRPAPTAPPKPPPPAAIARAEAPATDLAPPETTPPGATTATPPVPPPPPEGVPSPDSGTPAALQRPDPAPPMSAEPPPIRAPESPAKTAIGPHPGPQTAPQPPAPPSATVPTGPVIATIEAARGIAQIVADAGRIPAVPGTEIREGTGLETRGNGSRLAFRYPDGTRIELRGDTAVRPPPAPPARGRPGSPAGKRWMLSSGTLAAEVARQPFDAPLLIHTPTAEASVLGTAFRITCSPHATRLDVWEGKVRLTRSADRASVTVPAGHFAVSTAAKGDPLVARVGRVETGLLALYAFDEGAGDTVHETGNSQPRLDLRIGNPGSVRWLPHGLAILGEAGIGSDGSASRIAATIRQRHELTLEAWVRPDPSNPKGPAGILLLEGCALHPIALLGYGGMDTPAGLYRGFLRTTVNDGDAKAFLAAPDRAGDSRLAHVVFTREGGGAARLYIDGREQAAGRIAGEIPACTVPHRLLLGSGLAGDAPWQGELHLAAIYGRPLSADEVRRNHLAGCGGISCSGSR